GFTGMLNFLVLLLDPAVIRTLIKCAENVVTTEFQNGAYLAGLTFSSYTFQSHTPSVEPSQRISAIDEFNSDLGFTRNYSPSCDTLVA
ncbi:hypothetical protein L0F63_006471, partial [Massospora cicadina]